MDILKLNITNFLTIGESGDLALCDKGLVLIQGKNEDDTSQVSNGAGKSSILNAIYFVLYGVGVKIITTGEKKCSVRFIYNGFDIIRNKGPKKSRKRMFNEEESAGSYNKEKVRSRIN